MTTPQPSSPGATRAAGVLTAAGRLHHQQQQQQHSFTPYASGDQHHLYHPASTSASSTYSPYLPPPTSSTSGARGGGPSSHQSHYTTTTTAASQQQSPLQGFSPSLFENKIELPPATLPPPVSTSARRPSFQQPQPHPQEYYHRHHHQASIPPPIASTSAASASAVEASPPPAAYLKKESKASTTTNPVKAAAHAATLASTPSSSLKSDTKVAENAKSGLSSSSSSSRKRALSTSDPSTTSAAEAAATIPATTSGSATKKKPTRRYNASCDACRARKRKCPGRDPVTGKTLCTACADRGVECTYGNLGEPSRLRRADTENEKLRTIITSAFQAETAEEKDDILATITERMLASSASGHHAGKSRRSSEAPEESAPGLAKRFKEEQDEDAASVASTTPAAATVTSQPESSHLKPTYLSHLPSHAMNGADSQHATGVPSPRPSSDEETSAQFTQAVISNEQERGQGDSELERHVSFYLSMALPHGDFQDAPSPADDQRLLEFYFSWLNPRYALLSRKFFEQSRHLEDGVYCTPFLLWSLYAHSATHCPGFEKHQAYFRARAHILLTKELCKGKAATLPLAQGLILLAGTAAAKSDHSLAWTLSYTVTGMVIDLLETMDQSITENERIMRKRLYWSHCVWALVLALALNRKPCVPKLKVDLPDIGTDTDLWQAALPVRSIEEPPQTLAIPRPGHELECFKKTCQLFSFLDEILSNVYVAAHDKRNPETINNAVRSIQERMTTWQNTKLSSNILLNAQDLPALCPPPHIIHFNLLLRAIWILLYRPFYNLGSRAKNPIKGARQSCNQCASEIYAIFLYLEQNFGVLQLHFSFIYSAYWAATIDVASAKRDGLNPDLLARLRNSSRILLTWISLPGMRQSVSDLIEQIEALLLADVPPQLPQTSEVFSAYDPLHQPPQPGQEMIMHNNNSDAYYAQMGNMLRPQQDFMLSDPMLGVAPPLDYGPLGGLYWDSAAPPLW